jgi:predicted regulator of Ras-like GTPase activity (Roadblock/LC7/MglB family)
MPMKNLTSTTDLLKEIIFELENLDNVKSCFIINRDGILISSDRPEDFVAETFAAMSATMFGAAETAAAIFNKELVNRVIVETKHSKLICMGAGPKALLVAIAGPDVHLGLILMEFEKAVVKLKKIM